MKKLVWVLSLCAAVLALVGCGQTPQENQGKLQVVTTVYPVYDVVKKVAGDRADVTLLVPPGAEPHDWEPTASDLKKIGQAKVFFYNGAGLEPTDQILKKEITRDATVVELSQGLDLLKLQDDDDHDHDHDHDADHHDEDHHDEDHHAEGHHHHHHGGVDPHVWLDPQNVMKEAAVVADALAKADPAHADAYRANAKKYQDELAALDKDMDAALSSLANKNLVVSHEAFGYLAARYGLTQIGIMGVDADAEPTPDRMAQLVEFIREHDVRTIYSEELVNPRLADAIAAETGAVVRVLNPIEGLTAAQEKAGYDYIKLQRENLTTLTAGQQ
ncbi:zinc transport system substrate-binding protein [Negativicoccus succinicivorans]|uniref:Zinc transport system substrate-binding protein n=1 Tax=Negativicoccus succinicivorans TaxID=620903 RepID=A0A841R2X7_9FIRM|nr:zinc ABC transporter substrate-binding protein [Negativicoccus succinicivorans]MBB6477440.1 zinc transport system substrate-binding protein [Negativicoccus succinicivorans]MDU2929550.1 zinc ABC transporter substrate-binding protein [Negativicoccus succinicivorans]MDU4558720.1 zinc ABC transporter substrate-binding protein [Negativicoccus succinicivorans]MDU6872138.1 zinc ABC transporter substrate-binding protein [Negativicoccus succinicivorans]